jgi:hypothetical protein
MNRDRSGLANLARTGCTSSAGQLPLNVRLFGPPLSTSSGGNEARIDRLSPGAVLHQLESEPLPPLSIATTRRSSVRNSSGRRPRGEPFARLEQATRSRIRPTVSSSKVRSACSRHGAVFAFGPPANLLGLQSGTANEQCRAIPHSALLISDDGRSLKSSLCFFNIA